MSMFRMSLVPRFFWTVSIVVLLGVEAGAADGDRPDGFGGVKFNATTEELKAALPALERLGVPPAVDGGEAAPPQEPVVVEMYQLAQFPVEDLGTCNVIFHTYFDRFAKVEFYCLEKDKIEDYLVSLYGPSTSLLGTAKLWSGDNQIVYTPHLGTFSYSSQSLHDAMQTKLFLHYMGRGGEAQPDSAGKGDATK